MINKRVIEKMKGQSTLGSVHKLNNLHLLKKNYIANEKTVKKSKDIVPFR